jgi:hypothetical protein
MLSASLCIVDITSLQTVHVSYIFPYVNHHHKKKNVAVPASIKLTTKEAFSVVYFTMLPLSDNSADGRTSDKVIN